MYRTAVERGPAVAFWLLALAAQVSGYSNAAIALSVAGLAVFFLVAPVWHHARNWHLRRVALGPQVMGTPQIILLTGLAGAWVFLTVVIGAGAWLVMRPHEVSEITSTIPATSNTKAPAVTTSQDDGPLTWYSGLAMEGGPPVGTNVFSLRFRGVNSSHKEIRIKDANVISAINGAKLECEIVAASEIVPIDQVELIPAGASIELVAKFGPPDPNNPGKILGLEPKTWLDTWRQFSLNVEDDTRTYRVIFSEANLLAFFPGILGPHVSKKAHQDGK